MRNFFRQRGHEPKEQGSARGGSGRCCYYRSGGRGFSCDPREGSHPRNLKNRRRQEKRVFIDVLALVVEEEEKSNQKEGIGDGIKK